MAKLILDLPVDFVSHLLGEWLALRHLCKLEIALCSAGNRVSTRPIYENLISENYAIIGNAAMVKQFEWLLVRRVRLHSFYAEFPVPERTFSTVVALLKHSSTHLKTLDINDNKALLQVTAATVSRYCANVEKVKLTDMKISGGVLNMLSSLRNLKELSFVECKEVKFEYLDGLFWPCLTTLSLDGEFSIQTRKAIVRMCPNFVNFCIEHAYDIELHDLPPTVQSIYALDCRFVQVENFKADIRSLVLLACSIPNNTVACLLGSSTNLQELDILGAYLLTDAVMEMIGDKYGHSIRHLGLYWDTPVTVTGMCYLLKRCTALTSLKLGRFDQPDPNVINTLLENCLRLHTLDISTATVTDDFLAKISVAPLETLFMCFTTGYTETGFLALIRGCPSLKFLSIQRNLFNPLALLLLKEMRPRLEIDI